MGCATSKRVDVAVDAYRPPPSSFAVFDVNAIEEPWVKDGGDAPDSLDEKEKPSHVPVPLLDKLNAIDDAPHSWNEVSKTLEDLKAAALPPPPSDEKQAAEGPRIHTLEELEKKKVSPKPTENKRVDTAPKQHELKRLTEPRNGEVPRSLKDNIFIVRDKMEREKEGKTEGFVKWNPLNDFEEICPPGGGDTVVVYTTSLGGVRRTYEDCNKVRQLMETYQVVFDERDVALDGGFLSELRELLGEGAAVPRVFVKGRYIGGVEEVVGLNETGRLSRILNSARVERGVGRLGCGGCGGKRFVPCMGCGGSCKIVVGDERVKCGECNENGLTQCPVCV